MDCPVCSEAMITLQVTDIEVDFCTNCQGIWLDGGELELMLENADRAQSLLKSFRAVANDPIQRKCPICNRIMKRLKVDQAEDLTIDKCPKNHGLWFDRGELQQILSKARLDDEHQIQKALAQIFEPEDQS